MTLRVISWDSETASFSEGNLAPEIACLTWQENQNGDARIVHAYGAEALMRGWLESPEVLFVGHNVAYDFGVIIANFPKLRKLVFNAYKTNRVTDTMLRERLLHIAAGTAKGSIDKNGIKRAPLYDLENLARIRAGMYLTKDALRLLYGEFIAVPLERWPERMQEIQAKASITLNDALARLADEKAKKPAKLRDQKLIKQLEKDIKGLESLIESDASRCTEYPLDDARATAAVFFAQEKHARYLKDQFRQARAAWALHLGSVWGICVDQVGAEALKAIVEADRELLNEMLLEAGLIDAKGKRNTKAAKKKMVEVCREQGIPIQYSEGHYKKKRQDYECPLGDLCEEHIALDADACERTDDELLMAYAERTTLTKQLSTDIPALMKGVYFPLHTRYWLAETGRSTSSSPNIQNQSSRPGFREAFIARPGYWFMQCDFPTLELYTLAQCCITWFGESALAEMLLSGKDPHLNVAAIMLKATYEDCLANLKDPTVKKTRTLAKLGNFGFPGGMGAEKFLTSVRKQIMARAKTVEEGRQQWAELDLDIDRVKQLKYEWLDALPEMKKYFERVRWTGQNSVDGLANVETLFTERMRGNATYCARANNGFQALGADCAKNAVWRVTEAQYVIDASPLFNTRTVAFIHDEIIAEVRAVPRIAHAAAYELGKIMADGANEFLPDVPIPYSKMIPTLMERWSKQAETVFDADGFLTPWDAPRIAS